MNTMVRFIIGSLLAIVGLVFFLVSLVALFDPVGTQMADDSDPFGPPPPWYAAVVSGIVSGGIAASGMWLLRRRAGSGGRAV
jgi:hypothetical protein